MPCHYYRPALLGTLPGEFRLECEPIYHGPTTSQQVGYNNTTIINLPQGYYRRPYLYVYVSTIIEQAATGCGRYDVAGLPQWLRITPYCHDRDNVGRTCCCHTIYVLGLDSVSSRRPWPRLPCRRPRLPPLPPSRRSLGDPAPPSG